MGGGVGDLTWNHRRHLIVWETKIVSAGVPIQPTTAPPSLPLLPDSFPDVSGEDPGRNKGEVTSPVTVLHPVSNSALFFFFYLAGSKSAGPADFGPKSKYYSNNKE